ncbi:MAG: hypothetical protein AAGE96_08765 [Cyanobacteria bacterium P01_G01_bin.19]
MNINTLPTHNFKNKFCYKIAGISLFLTAVFGFPVLADQCSYVKKEQAITAISRLDIGDTIYKLCEPCGEEIAQPVVIQSLSMEKVNYEDYWQIKANGTGIDFAYIFVESGVENNAVNLAAIADCPAQRVSPFLPDNSIQSETFEDEPDI